ncbi:MAG: methylaspartate mutase [Candidatus Eisenbacteria bacterium]|uniref:Methylaspartate mutase n=1 Tax=Eiseniibacteriota bacterium TaxID=2212470 RepID=A0A849T375_UNCEI|nr:methylaspartate mutase [Candidatus Eisenbacteria bacterium]
MSAPPLVRSILATDCGSTTTKAILIERGESGYRLVSRGEAPTTVEAPFEDVTRGVLNAVREIEELRGRRMLDGDRILTPQNGDEGVDLYVSTSSAGGGLQMMVSGLVLQMTGESAQRAALGAGAIVMDVIALNDGRRPHEKIQRLRQLRPDMILLSGGTDGGDTLRVVEMAEILAAADPKARLGAGYELPVIFAGNQAAVPMVRECLEKRTALLVVPNLRPTLERENLRPARDAIHELFMEHVMAHAPGYKKLMTWSRVPIMPTPGAVGLIIEKIAKRDSIAVVGVDIGGATTDVFSVFQEVFNRTVSANLGMSYSVSNVLAEAGIENILRWVPFDVDEVELRNRIKNKMIRPTTIPHTLEDLVIEQAISREALRLAFEQHKQLATGLKGIQTERTISDIVNQSESGASLVDLLQLGLLVGSGGVLSHAPRRVQSALMMVDAFLPEGVTELAVDSIFMAPQLGVLSTVHEEAATQVFEADCLIRLGSVVAPIGAAREGQPCVTVQLTGPGVDASPRRVAFGELVVLPLPADGKLRLTATPEKGFDLGAGKGRPIETEIRGGVVGLIVDARGRRPFQLPSTTAERIRRLRAWNAALSVYPREV